jgi:hypothetical protein
LTELSLPANITIAFPEGADKPMHFEISIRPDEGIYRCARVWCGGVRVCMLTTCCAAQARAHRVVCLPLLHHALPPSTHTHTISVRGGKFLFDFQISTGYPYDAPKVKCKTKVVLAPRVLAAQPWQQRQQLSSGSGSSSRRGPGSICAVRAVAATTCACRRTCTRARTLQVYHPNIDLDGNICLNILREDWKPVLSITSVVYGLQFLFLVRLCVCVYVCACVCVCLRVFACARVYVRVRVRALGGLP